MTTRQWHRESGNSSYNCSEAQQQQASAPSLPSPNHGQPAAPSSHSDSQNHLNHAVSESGQNISYRPQLGQTFDQTNVFAMPPQQLWDYHSVASVPPASSLSSIWKAQGDTDAASALYTSPELAVGSSTQSTLDWLSGSPLLGADIPSYHGLPVAFPLERPLLSHISDVFAAGDKVTNSNRFHNLIPYTQSNSVQSGVPAFPSDQPRFPVQYKPESNATTSNDSLTADLWRDLPPQKVDSDAPEQVESASNRASRLAANVMSSQVPWLVGPEISSSDGELSGMPGIAEHLDFLTEANLQPLQWTFATSTGHEQNANEESTTRTVEHGSIAHGNGGRAPLSRASTAKYCEECRSNGTSCDINEKFTKRRNMGEKMNEASPLKCSGCEKSGQDCVTKFKANVKKHGRPSRTGRRIEQARRMHGSVNSQGVPPDPAYMPNDLGQSGLTFPGLDSLQRSEGRLSASVISGAISLRLLTCFFATAHIQVPIVEFASFSSRYNLAKGDARIMSIMLNGGDEGQDIPSMKVVIPGLKADRWPETDESTISTPGTSETLIAVMQAWAAHYTDMPIAFGSKAEALGMKNDARSRAVNSESGRHPASDGEKHSHQSSRGEQIDGSYAGGDPLDSAESHLPKHSKAAKRKQGVACDTCRLRRVRCDLMERKDGMSCSRCQDKKIVCTDDYIQTKRRKSEAKNRKERERRQRSMAGSGRSDTGSSSGGGASSDGPYYYNSGMSMADQLGDNPDPLAWTEVPATPEVLAGSPKFPSLIPLGEARQPFCHDLLTRAVVMIHKHQLLYRPSVEAVQALVLLVQLFYLVDPSFASEMTAAAASHMRALGLQSVDEIDEGDQRAVANLFNLMQLKRVWCSTWTGDAIATCVYRRLPNFEEEKAISIKSSIPASQATAGASAGGTSGLSKGSDLPSSPRPRSGSGGLPSTSSNATRGSAPELTPEMGLSFSVMALMQIGVLARFVTKHIDGISGSILLPAQERFPMLPTSGDNKKLSKACHAVWKSNEALIAFFDRCTLKSWRQMEALKIFQPKSWIAACKVTSAMLMLSVYRILGERHRLNADYLGAVSRAHGAHVISAEDLNQSRHLRELFEQSSEKALVSCRRVARLIEKLLQKPSLTFQTGGIFLRQTFAISQFLARTQVQSPSERAEAVKGNDPALPPAPSPPPPSNPKSHVDPRCISMHSTGTFIPVVRPEPHHASPSDLYDLALDFNAPLPIFDAEARRREVAACLEALDQLGFAWPMKEELESVNSIVRGESTGRRFGHALA